MYQQYVLEELDVHEVCAGGGGVCYQNVLNRVRCINSLHAG